MVHICAFTDHRLHPGLPLWRPRAAASVREGSVVILEGVTSVLINKGRGEDLPGAVLSSLAVGAVGQRSLRAEGFYPGWGESQRFSLSF